MCSPPFFFFKQYKSVNSKVLELAGVSGSLPIFSLLCFSTAEFYSTFRLKTIFRYSMIPRLDAQKRAQATLGSYRSGYQRTFMNPSLNLQSVKLTTITSNEFLILSYPIFKKLWDRQFKRLHSTHQWQYNLRKKNIITKWPLHLKY